MRNGCSEFLSSTVGLNVASGSRSHTYKLMLLDYFMKMQNEDEDNVHILQILTYICSGTEAVIFGSIFIKHSYISWEDSTLGQPALIANSLAIARATSGPKYSAKQNPTPL